MRQRSTKARQITVRQLAARTLAAESSRNAASREQSAAKMVLSAANRKRVAARSMSNAAKTAVIAFSHAPQTLKATAACKKAAVQKQTRRPVAEQLAGKLLRPVIDMTNVRRSNGLTR